MKAKYENWMYLLASNGILLYGIVMMGWPIFPLVYLWWWEGLLNTAVGIFISKRLGNKNASWGQLFIYFIYWVFVVVFLGVMAANHEQVLVNLGAVMFQDKLFNLCLLLLILHLGFRVIKGNLPGYELLLLQMRLHVGIVLGGLAMFVSQYFEIDNVVAVALTILAVKVLLDVWSSGVAEPKELPQD
jgi:hypothetical protein